jgi:hypothetical protein
MRDIGFLLMFGSSRLGPTRPFLPPQVVSKKCWGSELRGSGGAEAWPLVGATRES